MPTCTLIDPAPIPRGRVLSHRGGKASSPSRCPETSIAQLRFEDNP